MNGLGVIASVATLNICQILITHNTGLTPRGCPFYYDQNFRISYRKNFNPIVPRLPRPFPRPNRRKYSLSHVCVGSSTMAKFAKMLFKNKKIESYFLSWTRPKTNLQCFALEQRRYKAKHCRNVLGRILGRKNKIQIWFLSVCSIQVNEDCK